MIERIPFYGGVEYFDDEQPGKVSRAFYPPGETEESAKKAGLFQVEADCFHLWDKEETT